MKTISIQCEFKFDAAHRLLDYDGPCRYLHGHSYCAQICIEAPKVQLQGFVLDFGDLKSSVGQWIQENWDHNVLLNEVDEFATLMLRKHRDVFKQTPYTMLGNPTAENMAKELFDVCESLLREDLQRINGRVLSVRIYETSTCWAEVTDRDEDYYETLDMRSLDDELGQEEDDSEDEEVE